MIKVMFQLKSVAIFRLTNTILKNVKKHITVSWIQILKSSSQTEYIVTNKLNNVKTSEIYKHEESVYVLI